jgi:hypothetical protein
MTKCRRYTHPVKGEWAMTRFAFVPLLALVAPVTACSSSSSSPADGGHDSAIHDTAADTEIAQDTGPAPDGAEAVRNTGAACTSAAQCTGLNAQCLTQFTNVPVVGTLGFPGGYCSSDCGPAGDCGADGYCLDGSAFGMPTLCTKKCTQASECRTGEGYQCTNIFGVFPQTMCFPSLQPPDGG